MKYRQRTEDRRPNGDVDFYARGERARAEGRPIWANPGIGQDAEKWLAGWRGAPIPWATLDRKDADPIPEFA